MGTEDRGDTIKIPSHLLEKWGSHVLHSEKFNLYVERLEAKYGDMTSKKRGAEAPTPSPAKHLKTDHESPAKMIDAHPLSEITTTPLAEIPVANLKTNQVVMQFMVGDVVYLSNKSENDITLPQHHVIALFPTKGAKFEKAMGDGKSMEFKIQSQDEIISLGSVIRDVREEIVQHIID